ncbi:hypothetical protein Bpfe_019668 [Biomphalaria pfeifferi]|uniref:Uncharacterized protein n=1 Tax=Biomphalaria pfeifferi TaxID=112525 RepID=A0AAD8F415_BIOPF|nr:hypothetical protein Bpfe_019668 [Biomphalaria pfeifferi]
MRYDFNNRFGSEAVSAPSTAFPIEQSATYVASKKEASSYTCSTLPHLMDSVRSQGLMVLGHNRSQGLMVLGHRV